MITADLEFKLTDTLDWQMDVTVHNQLNWSSKKH